MNSRIDYDALRTQTLGAGNDEAVTVNTRALIDKVLARYSGEWTTLRELLQNAADASSKQVKIGLQTLPSSTVPAPQSADSSIRLRHVLLHHTMELTKVENDGDVFQASDWARLKKIAEGNPDETKIGAFGVGFYSVFSECEEPFVSSGKEALAFYWKGDALFTKSRQLQDGQFSNTTFVLPNRNRDSPIPNLISLCRFLASSLTFVGLDRIELWLDEWKLMTLNKKNALPIDVQIPKEVTRKTRDGLMQVNSLTREASQLDAHWLKAVEWNTKSFAQSIVESSGSIAKGVQSSQSLRSFFHRLAPGVSNSAVMERLAKEEREAQQRISEDLMGESIATLFVHVNRASVKTLVNPKFATELERATKKPPPKSTTISLLSASYDESKASSTASLLQASSAAKIFDSFVPVNGKGRIFIGFTTNQTTGLNVHISTPSVIPTVERESIDLNNRYVRTWNVDLLHVAGIIARIAWGDEMTTIQNKLTRAAQSSGRKKIMREDVASVLPEALHLHESFNWSETTPSSEVGTLIEEAFWTCNQKVAIAILSNRGVFPASQVRLESEGLDFVEYLPSLPAALADAGLIQKLIHYGVVTEVTVSDIKSELESKALNAIQLRQFLAWLLQKVHINEVDTTVARSLLSVAVANDDDEDGKSKLIVLGEMTGFLNSSRIPASMPLPPYVLPYKFTKDISRALLETFFDDLQIVPWLRWLIENTGGRGDLGIERDITQSAPFAASVLPVISKQWEGLSQSSKVTVIELLSQRTIMPTKMGMKKPEDAYFSNVKLFDDLPVVVGLHAVKDKLLSSLGVRKTIDIGVVFDRLMDMSSLESRIPKSSTKWSHVDLIKYLSSVRQDIPPADIKRLRNTKICPAETESLQPTNERYLVSELYQPEQSIRRLKLPTLQWPGVYRPESAEGKFLTFLGLRTHPSYQDLIHIMSTAASNGDTNLRDQALRYFIDHHQTKGYASFDHASVKSAYLPIQGNQEKVAVPNDIFVNERAAILGFKILRRDLQIHALKFGVKQDPPIAMCIERLVSSSPQSKREAHEVFGYMAGRVADLNNQHTELLSQAKIVPVVSKKSGQEDVETGRASERITHIPPRGCFLGYGDSKYRDIFDYVDFGQEANSFLLRIGSKHEPNMSELATRLVREPAGLFTILGDARYLELLRNIADSWPVLKKDKALVKDMRASKCLLAYKEVGANPSSDENEGEESAVRSWELAQASSVVVVDDIITFTLFREALLAAPMEETLEALYHSLGSREVGALLEERQSLGKLEREQGPALQLERLLHERTQLFLHDYRTEAIKHDHHWVQKNLTVRCVQSISMTLSLQGYPLRRQLSKRAVLLNDKPILFVTNRFDMLEVSQAMAPLLLHRVKPQSILMFEMMLESSLNKLGRRGYNVQRIMNQKLKEAKIADERRRQQEAEERQKIKDNEAARAQSQAENAVKANEQRQMPGVFPGSPDPTTRASGALSIEEPQTSRPRGFWAGLGKQFSFDQVKQPPTQSNPLTRYNTQQLQPAPGDSPPPPYSQEDKGKRRPLSQPEAVTAPYQIQQNLANLVQASQPYNSNSLQNQATYNDVKETNTYCDAKPAQNVRFIGEAVGVRIFLDKEVQEEGITPAQFLAENTSALQLFASVLHECADSFALKQSAIHIFYDKSGSTIAFNANKALFFNYRYFESLHLPAVQQSNTSEAIVYWAVTMAHELAHNMISDHSSQHSYYTESLIMQYFGRISSRIGRPSGRFSLASDPLKPSDAGGRLLPDLD